MANSLEEERYFFDLLLVDNNYEIIDKAIPYFLVQGRSNFSISRNQVFSGDTDQIIDSDTVFEITGNQIANKYFLDYGDYKLDLSSQTFSSALEKMNFIYNNSQNKVALTFYVYSIADKLLISFPFDSKPYLTIYNKESKSSKTYSSLYDSIHFKWTFPPPKFSSQGTLITVLDINFVKAFLAEANTLIEPAIYTMLIEIEKGLRNPIILTYKIS